MCYMVREWALRTLSGVCEGTGKLDEVDLDSYEMVKEPSGEAQHPPQGMGAQDNADDLSRLSQVAQALAGALGGKAM